MAYECVKKFLIPLASQKLQDCLTWINNSDDQNLVRKYENSFKHLILSFKAFVALEKQAYAEAKFSLNQIVGINEMTKSEQAALYGIKSNVFAEYGVGGTREAFQWVRKALALDSSEPEWHFFLGKLHARQRHYALDRIVSDEELISLEKAHSLLKKPYTAVYLAECYCEKAKYLFHKQPMVNGERNIEFKTEMENKKLFQKALELFRDALNMNNDQCLHVMTRCARGFATLPEELKQTKLAKALAHKALDRSPSNPMILSTLSLIYAHEKNFTQAIILAVRSVERGAFGSNLKLLNLYHDGKKEFDLIKCLDRILKNFPEDLFQIQVHVYAFNYFLFVKRDLFKSLQYFEKALELDPQFSLLHERYVRWVKTYLNLYELVYNEIECAISKTSYVNEEELKKLVSIKQKIIVAWPSVNEIKIEKDLVNKLKANTRGRPRTRINRQREAPRKTKKNKRKNEGEKKSKPVVASKERSFSHKAQSSNQYFSTPSFNDKSGLNGQFKFQNKRAFSTGGRSQSREDHRRKILKEMENVRKSLSDLSIDSCGLRPDNSQFAWGSREAKASSNLEKSLSQLSLDDGCSAGMCKEKESQRNFHSSRKSYSSDRQGSLQNKPALSSSLSISADKSSFFPVFKSTAPGGNLTVENIERLQNVSMSVESLDSDDISDCHSVSEKSSTRKVESTSTINKSVSEDTSSPEIPVKEGKKSGGSDLFSMCEEHPMFVKTSRKTRLMVSDEKKLYQSQSRGGASRSQRSLCPETTLARHLRDLSLEKKEVKPSTRASPSLRPCEPTKSKFTGAANPFKREPLKEGRVLMPPGFRGRRRAESETSTSSADSDFIGSRWGDRSSNYR